MIRIDLFETRGRLITVRRIEPHVSRGKNSLPTPSPRPARGQRLEYRWAEARFELDWLETALGAAVTPERKRKWWWFW